MKMCEICRLLKVLFEGPVLVFISYCSHKTFPIDYVKIVVENNIAKYIQFVDYVFLSW